MLGLCLIPSSHLHPGSLSAALPLSPGGLSSEFSLCLWQECVPSGPVLFFCPVDSRHFWYILTAFPSFKGITFISSSVRNQLPFSVRSLLNLSICPPTGRISLYPLLSPSCFGSLRSHALLHFSRHGLQADGLLATHWNNKEMNFSFFLHTEILPCIPLWYNLRKYIKMFTIIHSLIQFILQVFLELLLF